MSSDILLIPIVFLVCIIVSCYQRCLSIMCLCMLNDFMHDLQLIYKVRTSDNYAGNMYFLLSNFCKNSVVSSHETTESCSYFLRQLYQLIGNRLTLLWLVLWFILRPFSSLNWSFFYPMCCFSIMLLNFLVLIRMSCINSQEILSL